jgi:general stress protein YciG
MQGVKKKLNNSEAEGTQSRAISVTEAGARGGAVTRDRYAGTGFYQRIGAKGGKKTAELYADLLKEFGRRGGRPRRPALDESVGERDRD